MIQLDQPDYFQTQGDTVRQLEAQLITATGPTNLTQAIAVNMRIKAPATTLVVPCEVLDAVNGRIRYVWPNGSTETPGDYYLQFVVIYPGNRTDTYPQGARSSLLLRRLPRL